MAEETKDSGYREYLNRASRETGIPYHILDAVMEMESRGKPKARSKKGAVGLMQLMPKTAQSLGVDPHDPEQNILGGARYLAEMLERFGSMEKALHAYNAGPTRVSKGRVPRQSRGYAKRVLALGETKRPWEPPTVAETPLALGLEGFLR